MRQEISDFYAKIKKALLSRAVVELVMTVGDLTARTYESDLVNDVDLSVI
jgi:hypothetical protein